MAALWRQACVMLVSLPGTPGTRLECCGPFPCLLSSPWSYEFLNHAKQSSSVCCIRNMDCISGTHALSKDRLSWKFTTWAPWVNQSSFKRPIQLHPFNHTNRTILPQCFAVSLNTCLYLQVYVHKHMKLGGWAASSPGNFCKTDTLTGLNLVGPF